MGLLLSVILLTMMSAPGVAVLRRFGRIFDPLEQLAYGAPLGIIGASLLLLYLAIVTAFAVWLILIIGAACVVVAVVIWPDRPSLAELATALPDLGNALRHRFGGSAACIRSRYRQVAVLPVLVIGAFIALWVSFYPNMLMLRPDGLWASNTHVWSDAHVHLGHATSFAYGNNFPPQNPFFAGAPLNYHYLASLTIAAMIKLGMDPISGMKLHGFILMCLVTLGVYSFARRLTHDSSVASLALVLFLLGGGLGWLLVVGHVDASHSLLQTLRTEPWNYTSSTAANFHWETTFLDGIAPTIGFLYGLPLLLLAVSALLAGVKTDKLSLFVLAGVVAGFMPLAHLGALLSLALIAPFLLLLFPPRNWLVFFAVWLAIAVPQILFQQGGSLNTTAGGIHLSLGWIAAPDSNPWFWLKNLGLFIPLLLLALADRRLFEPIERRFLWAFMPSFVIANLVAFQPSDWDNIKIFTFWFLAVVVMVAALLVKTWREHRAVLARSLLAVAAASLVLSGVLMHLQGALGLDTNQLMTADELNLAGAVRSQTPQHAIFAVGARINHPVSTLAGRTTMTYYWGYLFTWGISWQQRDADLRVIMAYGPQAPDLLRKYDISYVVIGPGDLQDYNANVAAYRAHYPEVIDTQTYEVFDVSTVTRAQR